MASKPVPTKNTKTGHSSMTIMRLVHVQGGLKDFTLKIKAYFVTLFLDSKLIFKVEKYTVAVKTKKLVNPK